MTDREVIVRAHEIVDVITGEPPAEAGMSLIARLLQVDAEVRRLRWLIQQAEWGDDRQWCPWCDGRKPAPFPVVHPEDFNGHRPTCPAFGSEA